MTSGDKLALPISTNLKALFGVICCLVPHLAVPQESASLFFGSLEESQDLGNYHPLSSLHLVVLLGVDESQLN